MKEMGAEALIIIENRNQVDKLISLAKKEQKQGDMKSTVVALSEDVAYELAARGLEFKTLEVYGLSEGDIEDEGIKWFRTWPDVKIEDNKNIKEIILHDNLSLWWLVDEMLYQNSFVFASVKEVVNKATILNRIVSAEKPSVIYYAQNNGPASGIIKLICKSRNIPAVAIPDSSRLKQRISQKLRAMVYIFGPWLRSFTRKIGWAMLGRNSKLRRPRGKRRILIFSGESWVDTYNLTTGELRKGDPYFDSVIELLKDKQDIALISIPGTFINWGIRTFREKSRQQDARYIPFERYLNRKVILNAWEAARTLHQDYQSLASGEGLKQALKIHNLPLYDIIEPNLSLTFSRGHLSTVIAIFETAKRIMGIENPDAIIVCGEFVVFERAIIAAAKLKGIPVLSVHHGGYSPYFIHYNYIEGDIGPNREATAPYCPIADKFAAWSKFDKDNVVQRGKVREDDIIISGHTRYDILTRADKIFNREKTFNRLNLDLGKKLVTWMALSEHFTPQENERNRNAICNVVRLLKDTQLVLKLHPAQQYAAPQYRKDKSFQPKILGGWATFTFELLHASDIVITHFCSTAIEAIILNKPLIVIDLDGKLSGVSYIESGASIAVHSEDALVSAMERLLHDEEARQKLAEAQRRYVRESGCSQNGQASQIVADLVTQMIEKSKPTKAV